MQFSLFGAAVAAPTAQDLDGIVLAGGQWVRAQADGARLSVLVDQPWRATALAAELALRNEPAELVEVGHTGSNGLIDVRTALRRELVPAAQRWTRGARLVPPPDLALTSGGLRLWAIAKGYRVDSGYLLVTPGTESGLHRAAGAQLAALGLAAVGVGERGRPGWRLTGVKRVRRFAELVGEPPAGAGVDWPS